MNPHNEPENMYRPEQQEGFGQGTEEDRSDAGFGGQTNGPRSYGPYAPDAFPQDYYPHPFHYRARPKRSFLVPALCCVIAAQFIALAACMLSIAHNRYYSANGRTSVNSVEIAAPEVRIYRGSGIYQENQTGIEDITPEIRKKIESVLPEIRERIESFEIYIPEIRMNPGRNRSGR